MIGNSGVRRLAAVGGALCGLLLFASEAATADPTVTGVSVSDSLIADGDVPGPLTVAIDFDVAMNTSIPPTLIFAPDVSSTLSLLLGESWTDSDTYTATYSVADANVDVDSVTIDVTGARDASGNLQQDYMPLRAFEIDTLNPLAPAVTGIVTDAGSSNADAVTNDSTLILSGAAESQSNVRLYRDGSPIGVPVAANGAGTWTFDYQGTPLADGTHSLTATATDVAGNVSPESAPLMVLVDTQGAPAPEGRSPPDGTRTNDTTPTFCWTAVTTDPGGSGVRDYGYSVLGPTLKSGTTTGTTYTPSSSSPLSDGNYTWKLRTRDVAGNLGAYGSSWSLVIDTVSPTVTTVASDVAIYDGDVGVGRFTVTATFSEAMNPAVMPTLTLTPNPTTTFTNAGGAWSPGNTVYTWTYDVVDVGVTLADIDVAVSGGQDAAGNVQVLGTNADYVDIDTQNPTVVIAVSDLAIYDGDVGVDHFPVTATFSEAMSTGVAPSVALSPDPTQAPATFTNPSGAWGGTGGNTAYTWTYDVLDAGVTVSDVDITVSGGRDVAGNLQVPNTNADYVDIDTRNPRATVTTDHTLIADGSPIYEGSLMLTVTVTYDEAMNTSTAPSIALQNGGTQWGGQMAIGWTGNTVYRVTFTHDATEEPSLPATAITAYARITSGSGARDLAGNADVGDDSPTFEIDTRKPRSTVTTDHTLIAGGSPIYEGSRVLTVTVTYDEAMNTSTAPTVTLQNAGSYWSSATSLGWTGGGTVYRATFTHTTAEDPSLPATAITAYARIINGSGARDLAGNADVGDDSPTFEIDTRKPRATVTVNRTVVSGGAPIYESALVLTVTVTYDEAMNTSTAPTVTLQNGGSHWSSPTLLGWTGNTVYRVTFTHDATEEPSLPATAITAYARIINGSGARDLAGNADVGDDSPTFEIDTRKPELTPGVAAVAVDTDPVYEGDLTQRVTLTFDEAMMTDGSVNPTITFDHGTWGTNGDGVWNSPTDTVWTETFTLVDNDEEFYDRTTGVSVVAVTASNARDAAGNLQEPYAAEPEFDIDTLKPKIAEFTSVPDGGCHVAGDTVNVTVRFSESVFGALTLNLDSGGIVDVLGVHDNDSETRRYTIRWGENSCDLDVEFAVVDAGGGLVDWAGNRAHWTGNEPNLSLPTGCNLADNGAVIVDTTLPIAVTDPNEDETRSGADSDIVEVRLDPQGRYRLIVRQDTPVYIDVLANDIEFPCLRYLSVYDFPVLPRYGTLPDENPANPLRYAPYAGCIGPDEFTYRAIDACGNVSVEATVYVEVIPQLAFADVYVTACAEASVAIVVAATDLFVPPGATEDTEFAFEIAEGPEHGIVAGNPTEVEATGAGISTRVIESATVKFTYAPASGFVGRDQFCVRVSDPFGMATTAVIDIEVQNCSWVVESPLVIPQGALLPLIVPLSFASVYETAWDTVTLTGGGGTEHPEAVLATWSESLGRPTLVINTGPLTLGAYELVIPLGNGEMVTLRFVVSEKP